MMADLLDVIVYRKDFQKIDLKFKKTNARTFYRANSSAIVA